MSMSRILVIPDIHNRTLWLEPFLDKMKDEYDRILFLGDYFDLFRLTLPLEDFSLVVVIKAFEFAGYRVVFVSDNAVYDAEFKGLVRMIPAVAA